MLEPSPTLTPLEQCVCLASEDMLYKGKVVRVWEHIVTWCTVMQKCAISALLIMNIIQLHCLKSRSPNMSNRVKIYRERKLVMWSCSFVERLQDSHHLIAPNCNDLHALYVLQLNGHSTTVKRALYITTIRPLNLFLDKFTHCKLYTVLFCWQIILLLSKKK